MKPNYYRLLGETRSLAEWCEIYGIPLQTAYMRIRRGVPVLEALSSPLGARSSVRKERRDTVKLTVGDRTQSLHTWCSEYGVDPLTTWKRIKRGWSAEEALTGKLGSFNSETLDARRAKGILGERFGMLKVIEAAGISQTKDRLWRCICDCGREAIYKATLLRMGRVTSCGCTKAERMSQNRRTHGKTHTPAYTAWCNMKSRCDDENRPQYKDWGGRGITYDPDWEDFEAFYRDMGDPPPNHSLDRVDNSGNYCKANCQWRTRDKQMRNTRANVWVTIGDRTQIMKDWCTEYAIHPRTVLRLAKGELSLEDLAKEENIAKSMTY